MRDLFNDLYDIDKERFEEQKKTLNKKDTQKVENTKLRLADDYLYESEEENKQTNKQTDKKPDTKERPKKPTKIDVKKLNRLIDKEEMGINRGLFKKYLNFQRPSEMLKFVYNTNDKKNNGLINMIKSGLSHLKNEIKNMFKNEIKIEKLDIIVDIVEKILQFNRQNQEG